MIEEDRRAGGRGEKMGSKSEDSPSRQEGGSKNRDKGREGKRIKEKGGPESNLAL